MIRAVGLIWSSWLCSGSNYWHETGALYKAHHNTPYKPSGNCSIGVLCIHTSVTPSNQKVWVAPESGLQEFKGHGPTILAMICLQSRGVLTRGHDELWLRVPSKTKLRVPKDNNIPISTHKVTMPSLHATPHPP